MGSTSYITNLDGDVVQHIEYVPFGEVFLEERNNKWNTPYLFYAKELDEETGLYYYGARYYDLRVSVWLSVDPLAIYNPFEKENFIDGKHNCGVYNSFNHAVYGYCYQKPILLVDPNGKQALPGALIGAFTEYGSKIGEKMLFEKMSFVEANKSLTRWDALDIGIAAGAGALSGFAKFAKFAKWAANPTNQKIIVMLLDTGISTLENVLKQYVSPDKEVNIGSALTGALVEVGLGNLIPKSKVFEESASNAKIDIKRAEDLISRASATMKTVSKQNVKLQKAEQELLLNNAMSFGQESISGITAKMSSTKTSEAVEKKK